MTHAEKIEQMEYHRDKAEALVEYSTETYLRQAQVHATLALFYLTDVLSES